MHARSDPSPALVRLIEAQDGAVSREQALALGLSASGVQRLVQSGTWRRIGPGIYSASLVAPGWPTQAWAGLLLGGAQACLGGAAAWYAHGLASEPPRTITVLVPATARRPVAEGPWEFVRTRRELRSRSSPPRTSIEDTVLDLCADPDLSLDRVVGFVTDAVQQRRTTERRLLHALGDRPRHPRRALLREVLGDVAVGVRSPLESRYLRDVERPHGLPSADRQIIRRRTEVDIRYGAQRLLVELDGRVGHAGSGKFRDMRRDNRATEDSLATLRYGFADVAADPCGVAEQVATVLRQRGWPGVLIPCRHCLASV